MRLVATDCREKHSAEPVQFGMPFAKFGSFNDCFCLQERIKSFGGTIREVQSFGLDRQKICQADDRAACPIIPCSLFNPRNAFNCVAGSAARPTAQDGSYVLKNDKIVTR
jgi:hypothetical protein